MSSNEIKKALYKEKPMAFNRRVSDGSYFYFCQCSLGTINFNIPADEVGTTDFKATMPAQLLIRWMEVPNA